MKTFFTYLMQQKGLNFTPCSMKRYENIFRIFVGLKVGQICEELSAHFCSSTTSMKTMRAKIKSFCPFFLQVRRFLSSLRRRLQSFEVFPDQNGLRSAKGNTQVKKETSSKQKYYSIVTTVSRNERHSC